VTRSDEPNQAPDDRPKEKLPEPLPDEDDERPPDSPFRTEEFEMSRRQVGHLLAREIYGGTLTPTRAHREVLAREAGVPLSAVRTREQAVRVAAAVLEVPAHQRRARMGVRSLSGDLTKEELYNRAKRLNIKRRSKMNKRQLQAAVNRRK
jgi:hypothetical protein